MSAKILTSNKIVIFLRYHRGLNRKFINIFRKSTYYLFKAVLLSCSLEFKLTILFKKFQITGPLYRTDSFPTSCITPGI